jgi:hypothetical protein
MSAIPLGCPNQLAECQCCGEETGDRGLVHAVRGDDCTGHALMCGACREACCWPEECERWRDCRHGGSPRECE